MQKVRAEVDGVVAKHRTSPEQKSLDILGAMSLDDWEHGFPMINVCLHESIRIITVGAGFRKNISDRDVRIGNTGEVIPKGAFAALHIDQIHMNPDIYKDPTKFDPGRFLPGREEDKKAPLAYAGWGQGRHPCCKFSPLISGPGNGNGPVFSGNEITNEFRCSGYESTSTIHTLHPWQGQAKQMTKND